MKEKVLRDSDNWLRNEGVYELANERKKKQYHKQEGRSGIWTNWLIDFTLQKYTQPPISMWPFECNNKAGTYTGRMRNSWRYEKEQELIRIKMK